MISKRPELTRDKVLELIREKRSKVGSGYLTDQGALFLVASDIGVTLKFDPNDARTRLRELTAEQRGITVVARIASLGLPRTFRKGTNDSFMFKIMLYDDSGTLNPTTVWDYNIGQKLFSAELGTLVKFSNCYTRSAPDGGVSLNVPESATVSVLNEQDPLAKQIPRSTDTAIGVEKLGSDSNSRLLTVRGAVASKASRRDFTRSRDNSQQHYVSFGLRPIDDVAAPETRVVLWGNSNPAISELRAGDVITLVGVKPRSNAFQGSEQLELHGDDSTIVLEKWQETRSWLNEEMKIFEKSKQRGMQTSTSPLPFVARVLSVGGISGIQGNESGAHFLLIDSWKRKISLTLLDEAASVAAAPNDVILCKPETFDEIGLRAVCRKRASVSKLKKERGDIPDSKLLETRIEHFEPGMIASLDAMTLSPTVAREIQTKDGSLVRRTEILLADPSGEIMLYAWRTLSKCLEGLGPGVRLWVRAAEVQAHEGRKFLLLKNYSSIEVRQES